MTVVPRGGEGEHYTCEEGSLDEITCATALVATCSKTHDHTVWCGMGQSRTAERTKEKILNCIPKRIEEHFSMRAGY